MLACQRQQLTRRYRAVFLRGTCRWFTPPEKTACTKGLILHHFYTFFTPAIGKFAPSFPAPA
ncbi:hypothetical protein DAQ1742_02998 [Dickeya aquatica]|uniref:Uncharacterized protein n=1 Tax=Dickeya aquatica TaxID=1401087 RepID=A0A375ACQ1_9GAMM|nr:hypothetical protein DAQ1742_02998 [Dickeya aquatica]